MQNEDVLTAAVIGQACRDAVRKPLNCKGAIREARATAEARVWLHSNNEEPFSLRWYVDSLGYDPDGVTERIRKMVEGGMIDVFGNTERATQQATGQGCCSAKITGGA